MRVSKWGNSLAVRIPASIVDALNLTEGDSIEIRLARDGAFEIAESSHAKEALGRLRAIRKPMPTDFKFDRSEINER